jgi:hypothetical protein
MNQGAQEAPQNMSSIAKPGSRANVPDNPSNDEISQLPLAKLLAWAAGKDDRLRGIRLARIAAAKQYRTGWVRRHRGRLWQQVVAETTAWRDQSNPFGAHDPWW